VSARVDYTDPAELYSSASRFKGHNSRYQRFPSIAEAIRYAIEEMPGAVLRGVAIESGDDRYEGDAIRALYDAPDYPFQRVTR
jgi:hypothetical protein